MTEEEYAARHFGVRCPEFLRSIGIDDSAEIDRLRRRKIELYPRYFDLVALNRPLWEFCQQFRKQGGRVWIVSTGQRANIDNVMRHLHLEAGVDGIISALDAPQSNSLQYTESQTCGRGGSGSFRPSFSIFIG